MALVIPLTILVLVVDFPTLWAIQRGLLALQAYYLHKQARSGRSVPLARSRIPIVGGELCMVLKTAVIFFVLL